MKLVEIVYFKGGFNITDTELKFLLLLLNSTQEIFINFCRTNRKHIPLSINLHNPYLADMDTEFSAQHSPQTDHFYLWNKYELQIYNSEWLQRAEVEKQWIKQLSFLLIDQTVKELWPSFSVRRKQNSWRLRVQIGLKTSIRSSAKYFIIAHRGTGSSHLEEVNPLSSEIGYQMLLSLLPKPEWGEGPSPSALVGRSMRVNSSRAGAGWGKEDNLHWWGLGWSQAGDN